MHVMIKKIDINALQENTVYGVKESHYKNLI